MRRFFCIHGHFYQPPRENPWLEEIEIEDSARPYHDWNERICAECYAPNTRARIVDGSGRIRRMINNYEWMSFNVGPTLLAWMERAARSVLEDMLEADRRSQDRCGGHGNAIAQPYTHAILPLATRRDKILQVHWGMESFRRYFDRDPEGMWLPEAAVDVETLELLADHGILFTVLSPRQGKELGVRLEGARQSSTGSRPDPRHPYRCGLPSGKEIAVFFYDEEITRRVAFQGLLSNGEALFRYMDSRFEPDRAESQLVHFATDGETFGHHHRLGEMALAYLVAHLEADEARRLTNYGEFLSLFPPTREAVIIEGTSWSCIHGVERWRSDCGCRTRGSTFHQRWRAPLRKALEHLGAEVDLLFEREGDKLFLNPWEALRSYIHVMLRGDEQGRMDFLGRVCSKSATARDKTRALKLLEMERHRQLMFTSCAWFFDDISTLETVHALKRTARAIQLAREVLGVSLEESFLSLLEGAQGNAPEVGDGRRLWEDRVRPSVADAERILAHGVTGRIFFDDRFIRVGKSYSVRILNEAVLGMGTPRFAGGVAEVRCELTLEETKGIYGVIYLGGTDLQIFCMPYRDEATYASLKHEWVSVFRGGCFWDLYRCLLQRFGSSSYGLGDLFRDEQQRVVEVILRERVEEYETLFRVLFNRDEPLLRYLSGLGRSTLEPMREAARICMDERIRGLARCMESEHDLRALFEVLDHAAIWGYRAQGEEWVGFFSRILEDKVQGLMRGRRIPAVLNEAGYVLDAADHLSLELNLWDTQNLYLEVCEKIPSLLYPHRDLVLAFARRIRLSEEALPVSLRFVEGDRRGPKTE